MAWGRSGVRVPLGPLKMTTIIVVFGLSGTGKTTISFWLASKMLIPVLSSDLFRKKRFGSRQYQESHSEEAMVDLLFESQRLFNSGIEKLIVDATFTKKKYRDMLFRFANENNSRVVWIEVKTKDQGFGSHNFDGLETYRLFDELKDVPDRLVYVNTFDDRSNFEQLYKSLLSKLRL